MSNPTPTAWTIIDYPDAGDVEFVFSDGSGITVDSDGNVSGYLSEVGTAALGNAIRRSN